MTDKIKSNAVLVIGNDGKLEITGRADIALSGSGKNEFHIDPAPIALKVDTATDWAAVLATLLVGISGIVTAAVVALFTHKSAKQAAAATAAGIRNEWMQDLRNEFAEFYAAVLDLSYVIHIEGKLDLGKGNEIKVFKMQKHRAFITMMLDADKPLVQKLIKVMDDILKAVSDGERKDIILLSREFLAQASDQLESAWQDINADLYGSIKKKKKETA